MKRGKYSRGLFMVATCQAHVDYICLLRVRAVELVVVSDPLGQLITRICSLAPHIWSQNIVLAFSLVKLFLHLFYLCEVLRLKPQMWKMLYFEDQKKHGFSFLMKLVNLSHIMYLIIWKGNLRKKFHYCYVILTSLFFVWMCVVKAVVRLTLICWGIQGLFGCYSSGY